MAAGLEPRVCGIGPFELACPECRTQLVVHQQHATCPGCGLAFDQCAGIWRMLPRARASRFEQFQREYQAVRRAEGRGTGQPEFYRALPWRDLSGRFADQWRVRATTFKAFLRRVLQPLEATRSRPLHVLDLGSGNGWLAYRLTQRGHRVMAIDISTDPLDGLGACGQYEVPFATVQADFDHLPLCADQADLVVFNASLHYSTDYALTLSEALRVLRPDGRVVILDSPVYHDPSSGRRMVHEREAQFRATYGFASNALASEHFLTPARLDALAAELGLAWQRISPWYGLAWATRPWRARLRGQREPASFGVIVGARR